MNVHIATAFNAAPYRVTMPGAETHVQSAVFIASDDWPKEAYAQKAPAAVCGGGLLRCYLTGTGESTEKK